MAEQLTPQELLARRTAQTNMAAEKAIRSAEVAQAAVDHPYDERSVYAGLHQVAKAAYPHLAEVDRQALEAAAIAEGQAAAEVFKGPTS